MRPIWINQARAAISKFDAHYNSGSEGNVILGSNWKQYVTFYFTNVPDMLLYHLAKEGFEVCGILDNLFLCRKRNKRSHLWNFVRYSNVRDVDKFLKAVNNVSFGQFRVWAKLACFDRNSDGADWRRDHVYAEGEGRKSKTENTGEEEEKNREKRKRSRWRKNTSMRDWGFSDAQSERVICLTSPQASRWSSELDEEDQERLLRLGGDLRGGNHLGGERLGDRRLQLGDLTLSECLGDLDLEQRGLLPILLQAGEGVSRIWISCLFYFSSSAICLL